MKKTLKKALSILLAVTMIFGTVAFGVADINWSELTIMAEAAETFTEGYYTYTLDENGNATITDVDTIISGHIAMPATLGGYTVTSIGDYAFSDCDSLMSITIPECLLSIGFEAFDGCDSFTNISIPDTKISIDSHAFKDTPLYNDEANWENDVLYIGKHLIEAKDSISGAYIIKEETIDIANAAFYNSNKLTSVKIPDSITIIQGNTFSYCDSLTSVTIPDSVTSIGHSAFSKCVSLASITIPDRVISIDSRAFQGCTNLLNVKIGNGITEIGLDAFEGTAIYNDETNWKDSVLYIDNYLIKAKDTIAGAYLIKEGTRVIADSTFRSCKNLTSVKLPNGITKIDSFTFGNCENLADVEIPNSVESIGYGAFINCENLTNVELPDRMTSIGEYAFENCDNLKSITIPNSIISIGESAFYGCNYLANVYYIGTEQEWDNIDIGKYNADLFDATIHFIGEDTENTGSEIFQENSYIADIWLNIDPRHQGSVDAGYVESILDLKSISSEIYADAQKNRDFQDSVALWNALKFAFDTPKALEDGLSKDEIYETLILDLLKKVMLADEEKTGNVLLDAVSKVGKYEDKVTKYKSAIDDVVKIPGDTSEALLDILKEWKFDPNSDSFTKFYGTLNDTNDMTKKWSDNKFVKGVGHLAKVANNVNEFYEMFVGYCLATDMAEEMAILLTEMKNSTEITPLQIALQNIINSFNNANYAAMVCTLEFAEDTTYKVMGALFDEVTKASPTYTALKTVYGAGVTFVDLTFNTSGTIDAYYLCEATKNFIDANKAAISKLENNYRNSKQEADAAAYVYAVRTFEQAHTIDLETSISFIKAASEEGLINLTKKLGRNIINFITGSDKKSTYESVLESKDSILYSVRGMYLHMDNAWKFNPDYLKTDYPEMYPIYVKEELSKEDYTPSINASYINEAGESVVEWSMPTLFYTENDDGSKDAHVLWGSMAMNGVRLREEIGDYSDVLEKGTDYAEGTLKMYSEENFEVFNKEYYLSTYSETNEGNVYTNEAKSSITNPIKKAYLSIPYVREFFNRNDLHNSGLSFAINDATNSRYDIVYKIYRKADSSDWSHIDTVDRVLSPFSNATVYTDTTAEAGKKYSYKVCSYSTFENGKTLYSDFSDEFSVTDSTSRFTENEINFRLVDPRKNILSKNSKLSQAVSLEESPHIEITWTVVENADFYEIYRVSSYGSSYKLIATVDGETYSYSDYDLDNGVAYEYAIISGYKDEKDGKAYEYSDMSIGEIEFDLGDVYSITWITDDRTSVKENVEGDKITAPNVLVEDGYRFVGWTPEVPDVMPAQDLTFIAVFEEINTDNSDEPTKPTKPSTEPTEPTTKPAEPTNKPSEPSTTKPVVTVPVPSVEIRRPSQTEIKYGDSIILHANVENLPEGAYIEWNADNDNFKIVSYSTERINCTVTPSANGSTVFTATVYDADGNEICSDTQTMTAKAGFFQKIIAFFKKLFGLTKVIPEAFKF